MFIDLYFLFLARVGLEILFCGVLGVVPVVLIHPLLDILRLFLVYIDFLSLSLYIYIYREREFLYV